MFIIQSDLHTPEAVWSSIPKVYQDLIRELEIKLYAIDAFKIAREEATDSDLQLRMQGNAFQGAFFAVSDVKERAGLDEAQLFESIRDQLQHKFGSKGARVVEDNMRVVRRGYDEIREITEKPQQQGQTALAIAKAPVMLRIQPEGKDPSTDIHSFWERTGAFYLSGKGNDNLADPFVSMSLIPASTGVFRDMTGIRFQHPEWIPENCTACGKCYTACPDTAIPGLVTEIGAVFETAVGRVKKQSDDVTDLQKTGMSLARRLKSLAQTSENGSDVHSLIQEAMNQERREGGAEQAIAAIDRELDGFKFALTRPYYTIPEKRQKGSGGLLSITVNPYTCKGCMECVEVCDDDALRTVSQSETSVAKLQRDWSFWLDLPTTPKDYIRVDDLDQGIGALETILLDKQNYLALSSGDGACLGCSEKTAIHLFVGTVEALMQPRVAAYVQQLRDLIQSLEQHVQLQLTKTLDLSDSDVMRQIADGASDHDLTLAEIAEKTQQAKGSKPVDPAWLKRTTQMIAQLKQMLHAYTQGTTGRGRSSMGILNATGCSSVWGSTYPFNPYPFPWANHLFQDSPSMAMGVFEGHMAKMAEGFAWVRKAKLELNGGYHPHQHDAEFTTFNWQHFTQEEWQMCPPVCVVGGDGAMYDIGFQNLSRALMSGKPIKVIVLDTQVYSNTGGQACTSGFMGQVSDMAQYGKAIQGKQEVRKEIGLIAMAHRTAFVLQSTISNANHMIEGFIKGLNSHRPALFNIYTSCQPEHGIGDDLGTRQARLAVHSRAYPIFSYDPDKGDTAHACFDLDGNPNIDSDWPTYPLKYMEHGREKTMEIVMTFADFAVTEGRFRKHFRYAPRDAWSDAMVPLHEFIECDDRSGKYPYIWATDPQGNLQRVMVSEVMVRSCEERKGFWTMLRAVARRDEKPVQMADVERRVREETFQKLTAGLWRMLGDDAAQPQVGGEPASAVEASNDYGDMAAWIETESCTSCDECIKINPTIFAYNEGGKAFVQNAKGGPYRDLVKAAEKCTAQVIHPGLPTDPQESDLESLIKRASKYN